MVTHGTLTAYNHDRCRCGACCEARRAYMTRYRERNLDALRAAERERSVMYTQRRRAVAAGAAIVDLVTLAQVVAKSGESCGLCGGAVDMGRRHPDPLSPSIDHVKPLANGGDHTVANCQLAHLRCNSRKNGKRKVA